MNHSDNNKNNNDAKHSDDHFSSMEEIFVELASSQRLSIIFMISSQRLRLSALAKSLNLTIQEVHRNTNRLLDAGLIEKNSEGVFFPTTFGNAITRQLSIFEFLSSNKGYFSIHNRVMEKTLRGIKRIHIWNSSTNSTRTDSGCNTQSQK